MAALEQAIRTNNIKVTVDKTQENSKCRISRKAKNSVNHVLSESSKLALKENKRRNEDDFRVQTDHEIYGRTPDVIVVQKDKNLCQITDFA